MIPQNLSCFLGLREPNTHIYGSNVTFRLCTSHTAAPRLSGLLSGVWSHAAWGCSSLLRVAFVLDESTNACCLCPAVHLCASCRFWSMRFQADTVIVELLCASTRANMQDSLGSQSLAQ